MLHLGGDGDDGAGIHRDGFLAPLLIPAATADADEHLYCPVVDVPIVAATGLEGDVMHAATPCDAPSASDCLLLP